MTQDGQPPLTTNAGSNGVVRDPGAIVSEIEQTRAELADTIDRIADRVSPKRAASRGVDAVKGYVEAAKNGDLPVPTAAAVAATVVVIGAAMAFLLRRRSR
jgi:hypothetical protein